MSLLLKTFVSLFVHKLISHFEIQMDFLGDLTWVILLINGSQKLQWTKENKLQFLHLTIMEGMEVSWPVGENGSALETNFTGSLGSPMSIFSSKKFG